MEESLNIESLAELMGKTVEEIEEDVFGIFYNLLPMLIREMLSRGLIDLTKKDDKQYLWNVFKEKSKEVVYGLKQLVRLHDEFIELANYALEKNKKHSVVILVATAIEHSLNLYYRELLEIKAFPPEEITQIIRASNIQAKMGWLMSLTGESSISKDICKRIDQIIELRNSIIHYKAIPSKIDVEDGSYEKIQNMLEKQNLAESINVAKELENFLIEALNNVDPNRKLALELLETMLQP